MAAKVTAGLTVLDIESGSSRDDDCTGSKEWPSKSEWDYIHNSLEALATRIPARVQAVEDSFDKQKREATSKNDELKRK